MSTGNKWILALGASLALLSAVPSPCAHAGSSDTSQNASAMPDTPAGRAAAAFIAMWNDGSPEAVTKFEKTHASAKRLGAVPMEERPGRIAELRDRWGAIKVTSVTGAGEQTVTAIAMSATGDRLELEFAMSPSEPGKLDAVMIGSDDGPRPAPISAEVRADTVDGVAKALEEGYVYPEVASKMAAAIRQNLESGAYDGITEDRAFARRLTDDLRAISNDRHLGVRPLPPGGMPRGDPRPQMAAGRGNYGFRHVEILPDNVGYIRFDGFIESEEAQKTAAAALAFVAHTDALIFDLRYNGGGSPEMIRFITSYLFGKPTHLNDMVDREGNVVGEFWTNSEVPGERFADDLPVLVLTSSRTFSGAEEFSYNLKNLKRATIVGETTGGGAHPVRFVQINDTFGMGVPHMRARNPISGTNWEGTGVEPDVKVPAAEALEKAKELARAAIKR